MAEGGGRVVRGAIPALAAGRFLGPAGVWQGGWHWLGQGLAREAEQRRLFPWLAVAFGAGILLFFTATDGEPSLVAPVIGAGPTAYPTRNPARP